MSGHTAPGCLPYEIVNQTISGTAYTYTYGPADGNGLPVVQAFTKGSSQYYLDHDNTGLPLALHVPSGNSNFYVLDALGTPMGMINQSGTVTATYTWDTAGINTSTTGAGEAATVSPVGYASGFNGRTTGLTKFGARWDDTATNAFTSTDPITRLLDPNNANQYAYAGSNPIDYVDPTGALLDDLLEIASIGSDVVTGCFAGTAAAEESGIGEAAFVFGGPVGGGVAAGAACFAGGSITAAGGGDIEQY